MISDLIKSPAFLFYSSDFLTGVIAMNFEERGQYITLMCLQHQRGHLDKKTIDAVVPNVSDSVMEKFIKDKKGLYFNKRLDDEINKRNAYSKSRSQNRSAKKTKPKGKDMKNICKSYDKHMDTKTYDKHMDNENDIDNDNDNNTNSISIVNYLNARAGTQYKVSSSKTKSLIKARMNEGFTVQDFETVIDKKCTEWVGTKWEKYLRPETLFGTKFEGYLNSKVTSQARNPFLDALQEGKYD